MDSESRERLIDALKDIEVAIKGLSKVVMAAWTATKDIDKLSSDIFIKTTNDVTPTPYKKGDWVRDGFDRLAEIVTEPIACHGSRLATIKYQDGRELKAQFWFQPIGIWRQGDVLKDENGQILMITKILATPEGDVRNEYQNLSHGGTGQFFNSSDYSKNLKPWFLNRKED